MPDKRNVLHGKEKWEVQTYINNNADSIDGKLNIIELLDMLNADLDITEVELTESNVKAICKEFGVRLLRKRAITHASHSDAMHIRQEVIAREVRDISRAIGREPSAALMAICRRQSIAIVQDLDNPEQKDLDVEEPQNPVLPKKHEGLVNFP